MTCSVTSCEVKGRRHANTFPQISDGSESEDLLWAGCGDINEPFTAVSSGRTMKIMLRTDIDVQLPGFSANYQQVLTGT